MNRQQLLKEVQNYKGDHTPVLGVGHVARPTNRNACKSDKDGVGPTSNIQTLQALSTLQRVGCGKRQQLLLARSTLTCPTTSSPVVPAPMQESHPRSNTTPGPRTIAHPALNATTGNKTKRASTTRPSPSSSSSNPYPATFLTCRMSDVTVVGPSIQTAIRGAPHPPLHAGACILHWPVNEHPVLLR